MDCFVASLLAMTICYLMIPSSIALICSASCFEPILHCASPPAMNQSPGWPVRTYMLRSSCVSPKPQIVPTRFVTSAPNSLVTSSSCGR